MTAAGYRLRVRREVSIDAGFGPAEYPDLPPVSADAHAVVASRDLLDQVAKAIWRGGDCVDVQVPLARALIRDRPGSDAAGT